MHEHGDMSLIGFTDGCDDGPGIDRVDGNGGEVFLDLLFHHGDLPGKIVFILGGDDIHFPAELFSHVDGAVLQSHMEGA